VQNEAKSSVRVKLLLLLLLLLSLLLLSLLSPSLQSSSLHVAPIALTSPNVVGDGDGGSVIGQKAETVARPDRDRN